MSFRYIYFLDFDAVRGAVIILYTPPPAAYLRASIKAMFVLCLKHTRAGEKGIISTDIFTLSSSHNAFDRCRVTTHRKKKTETQSLLCVCVWNASEGHFFVTTPLNIHKQNTHIQYVGKVNRSEILPHTRYISNCKGKKAAKPKKIEEKLLVWFSLSLSVSLLMYSGEEKLTFARLLI